jgi:putative GTP pyrophosphokinase
MENKQSADILAKFDQIYPLYEDLTQVVENLLKGILQLKGINVHSITARVKDRTSLKKKVSREDDKYTKLDDITDLAGIRIITYFADQVDLVAGIVEQEFDVDRENSVDKRILIDPEKFGYLSIHYVVELPPNRLQLIEYQRFKGCKVEIQIRSILQHTWAEIEHDLGYKTKQAVPRDIRRSFSRLAGLLELADEEFVKIRSNLAHYEAQVQAQIEKTPTSVLIDQASLKSFVLRSKQISKFDFEISQIVNANLELNDGFFGYLTPVFTYLGIKTIAELDEILQDIGEELLNYPRIWLRKNKGEKVNRGTSLFYLGYAIVGRSGSYQTVIDYLERFKIETHESRSELANQIISSYLIREQ